MRKKAVSFILSITLCLAALVSCEKSGPDGESAESTEPAVEYSISYELDGGTWKKIYYTPAELFDRYKADFNEAGVKLSEPGDLDSSKTDPTVFGQIYASTKMQMKWFWLLRALWNQSEKDKAMNPQSCTFTDEKVRNFYLVQLCGFFTGTKHTDSTLNLTGTDFSDPDLCSLIAENGPVKDDTPGDEKYLSGRKLSLKVLEKEAYVFCGWKNGDSVITEIDEKTRGNLVLTAVWQEAVKPTDVVLGSIPADGIGLYDTLQLSWEVTPADAYDKKVKIKSLDTNILTVNDKGLVTAKNAGTAKIRFTLTANPEFEKTVEIKVYTGNYFEAAYLGNSYTFIGEDVSLKSVFHDAYGETHPVSWTALTPEIASVDSKGTVHPLKAGLAKFRSSYDETHYLDFTVTVLEGNVSDEMKLVLDSHNSNALTVYNLGIGSGTPAYYYDVVGSVSDLLFDDLTVDRTYYDRQKSGENNYGPMSSVEFVTVHYAGNMNSGADADNTAAYCTNNTKDVSIHYVTGRTNLASYGGTWTPDNYAAFACLNEKYGAWHASTGSNPVSWDKTGVKVRDIDPATPEISISADLYYTINGQKTIIKIPTPPDGYVVNGNSVTADGKTDTAINYMGLRTKVVDGEYYLARTWWGKQRSPKALSTYGGNMNSIGIETCVDIGSDLMHTWHVTAQLVADILVRQNLTTDRVVGHHFFSGKDCPQPLLENDLQLWYEFMDMVEAEYAKQKLYGDAKITAKVLDGAGLLKDNGLLTQDSKTHIVTYEVTVEKNGKTEKVTLATCVESFYSFTGSRSTKSLQQQGYDIR